MGEQAFRWEIDEATGQPKVNYISKVRNDIRDAKSPSPSAIKRWIAPVARHYFRLGKYSDVEEAKKSIDGLVKFQHEAMLNAASD